ncbi:ATP-binding protein [Legionella saoudiensis]|uniref:hypothetical protein n=1 Tax=Legionella saoudiensis TaxID=1750561 RepID=UPI000730DBC5|nr:hypothetical protein [Legionella saoudiensis]
MIQNFRSIKRIKFNSLDYTLLVGANNVGKTTIRCFYDFSTEVALFRRLIDDGLLKLPEGCEILQTDGKYNTVRFLMLLGALGIPFITVSTLFKEEIPNLSYIEEKVSASSAQFISPGTLLNNISYSMFKMLIEISDDIKRHFYEVECKWKLVG